MDAHILVVATPIWMGQPGNEDGAHHVTAEVLQALDDRTTTGAATKTLAANTAHLARLLADRPYPPA